VSVTALASAMSFSKLVAPPGAGEKDMYAVVHQLTPEPEIQKACEDFFK
jgi:hypothetical protein